MDKGTEFKVDAETYEIPADRHYSRDDHMWARWDPSQGQVVVGMDSLGLAALGDLVYVTLPAVGTAVQRGMPMGTLEAAKMTGSLFAPVSGVITARNDAAARNPALINEDAYSDGWLVAIQPEDWPADSSQLVSGEELPGWVGSELERYRKQGWID